MKKSVLILLTFLLFQANAAFGDSPYIRKSVGKFKKKDKKEIVVNKEKDLFPCRPVSSWVGERLIFLPMKKSLQRDYDGFLYDENGQRLLLDYNKFVGRIAQVISVDQEFNVKLKMENNSKIIILRCFKDDACVENIALAADIDNARKKWLGKTLFNRSILTLNIYNVNTGIRGYFEVKKNTPLKVIDIVAGWEWFRPVRFILQTSSGKE